MTKEFHFFMRMPPELRRMVWEYALPEPRVYEIMDTPQSKKKTEADQGLKFANTHHEPLPVLAVVCKESCSFVLNRYRPLKLEGKVKYVDLSRDLLLLEPYLQLQRLHRTLDFMSRIELIRNNMTAMALGTSFGVKTGISHQLLSPRVSKNNMVKLVTAMAKFPKLKDLLFVVHQEFQFEFDAEANMETIQSDSSLLSMAPFPAHSFSGPTIFSNSYNMDTTGHQRQSSMPPSPPPSTSTPSPMQQQLTSPVPPHSNLLPSPPPPHSAPMQTPVYSDTPAAIHQAQARQASQFASPPQVIHQAYRFQFDIESKINKGRYRPHLNKLLLYPLQEQNSTTQPVNWESRVNEYDPDKKLESGLSRAERARMSKPWPTDKDWNAFCNLFHRAVTEALRTGLTKNEDENAFCIADGFRPDPTISRKMASPYRKKSQKKSGEQTYNQNGGGFYAGNKRSNNSSGSTYGNTLNTMNSLYGTPSYGGVRKKKPAPNYKLKYVPPTVNGVSMLWRYTRGA